jgi:hypothetical protein
VRVGSKHLASLPISQLGSLAVTVSFLLAPSCWNGESQVQGRYSVVLGQDLGSVNALYPTCWLSAVPARYLLAAEEAGAYK